MKIAVVGDVMLDVYDYVSSSINPELEGAPNLKVEKRVYLPGGAANVARNLARLGSEVVLVGMVGEDEQAEKLKRILDRENILFFNITQKNRRTTTKRRILHQRSGYNYGRTNEEGCLELAGNDIDENFLAPRDLEDGYIMSLLGVVQDSRAIIFSDYAKGMATEGLLKGLKSMRLPIYADVKPCHKDLFRGVHLIKPNAREAREMTGLENEVEAGRRINVLLETEVLLTRAERGLAYINAKQVLELPTHAREVKDPTGCGDNVIATYVCLRENGYSLIDALKRANVAAGIAAGHLGCYAPTLAEIEREMQGN